MTSHVAVGCHLASRILSKRLPSLGFRVNERRRHLPRRLQGTGSVTDTADRQVVESTAAGSMMDPHPLAFIMAGDRVELNASGLQQYLLVCPE